MATVVSNFVEVCAFRGGSGPPEWLLLHRAKDEPLYPGIWQLITGEVLAETSLQGALRELREETGLAPLRFWVVPHVSSFYDSHHDAIVLVPLFAAQVAQDAPVILSREHDRYEWLTFEEAEKRLVWPAQRAGIRAVRELCFGGGEAGGLLEIKS
jgi:8-oxo-dGTP pyrophosphatase MutT (NUDIX family)